MTEQTIAAPSAPAAPPPAVVATTPVTPPVSAAPLTPVVSAVQAETPVSPPAPVAEKPPAAPAPAVTLLGADPVKPEVAPTIDAPKTPEVKPDAPPVEAAKAPAEQPKAPETQSAEPAPPPTYDAWKLPEGMTADTKGLGEFTGLLSEIELAKGDHAKMQEVGQKLVDRHVSVVQDVLQKQNEFYLDAFKKQKSDWASAFEKDPEIGGNRKETTLAAAHEFIRTVGGTVEQQKEFRDLMESTGVGNHPAMIRLLANANLTHREGKPVAAPKVVSQPTSKVEKRYGKMN